MFTYHVFITYMGNHNLEPPPQLMTIVMNYLKLNLLLQSHIVHLLKQVTSRIQLVGKQIKSQQQPSHTHQHCFKCAFFQKIQNFQILNRRESSKSCFNLISSNTTSTICSICFNNDTTHVILEVQICSIIFISFNQFRYFYVDLVLCNHVKNYFQFECTFM